MGTKDFQMYSKYHTVASNGTNQYNVYCKVMGNIFQPWHAVAHPDFGADAVVTHGNVFGDSPGIASLRFRLGGGRPPAANPPGGT